MKINFNNPHILRGHLEQALPQFEMEEVSQRFVIGREGGIGYRLFPSSDLPINLRIGTLKEINAAMAYQKAIQHYCFLIAGRIAASSKLELLKTEPNPSREKGLEQLGDNAYILDAMIGRREIEDATQFELFLHCLKVHKEKLDSALVEINELSGRIGQN